MPNFEEGTVQYGENRPPFKKKKCEYLGPKKDPFFQNRGHADLKKNRPFLSEIQNDDAYLLTPGVAGPG